jgi:phosphatidylserine decarboxylase
MRYDTNPIIARSGWLSVGVLALTTIVVWKLAGWIYAAPFAFLLVVLAFKFRDPDRPPPSARLGVVAPVDGEVLAVRMVEAGPFGVPALKVRLRVSPLTVYGVRSPIEGVVSDPAAYSAGATRLGFCLRNDEGDVMLMTIDHYGFGKPRPKVKLGQRLGHGERCGSIRFGHTVELHLPADSTPSVRPHDPVEAGVTVLAELSRV